MTLEEAFYKQKDELHALQREKRKLTKELDALRETTNKGIAFKILARINSILDLGYKEYINDLSERSLRGSKTKQTDLLLSSG